MYQYVIQLIYKVIYEALDENGGEKEAIIHFFA